MSLTIPRAGVIAGRAAVLPKQQAPQTGAMLSELGQGMAEMGARYTAERLDHQGKKIQLDIARDLAAARLEAEQQGDPLAIGQLWDTRKAEITDRYLNGSDEQGNPLVPVQLRPGIELTLGELDNRHTDALARKSAGLVQSQRAAGWIETYDRVAREASQADAETAGAMLEVAEDAIARQIAAGTMTPEEAAKQRIALHQTVAAGRASLAMEADPEGFLAATRTGEFDGLGGEALARAQARAQSEIYRRAAAAETAEAAAAKARSDAIGKRLIAMKTLISDGFTAADEAFLNDPEGMAHPEFAGVLAAQALRDEIPNLRQMTPAQLDAQIALERAAPKAHEYQTERVKLLESWAAETRKRWNSDAKTVAAEAGMKPPALPEFDPQAPDGFVVALGRAVAFDKFVRENGYTDAQALVTPEEKARLAAVLDPGADAGPKIDLARALLAGAGSEADAKRVLGVLGADAPLRRATWAIANTGDDALAAGILRGKQKIELKIATLPARSKLISVFDAATGGAFADHPELAAEMLDAAAALYADTAAGINPDGDSSIIPFMDDSEAVESFTSAIQRVSGAQADRSGRLTIGGVQEINDGFVSLPVGVPVAMVETTMTALEMRLAGMVKNPLPAQFGENRAWLSPSYLAQLSDIPAKPGAAVADIFKAASVDGRVPDLGADPQSAFAGAQLQRVYTTDGRETDQYIFIRSQNGRSTPISDANGVEYRFRLPVLMREAEK